MKRKNIRLFPSSRREARHVPVVSLVADEECVWWGFRGLGSLGARLLLGVLGCLESDWSEMTPRMSDSENVTREREAGLSVPEASREEEGSRRALSRQFSSANMRSLRELLLLYG